MTPAIRHRGAADELFEKLMVVLEHYIEGPKYRWRDLSVSCRRGTKKLNICRIYGVVGPYAIIFVSCRRGIGTPVYSCLAGVVGMPAYSHLHGRGFAPNPRLCYCKVSTISVNGRRLIRSAPFAGNFLINQPNPHPIASPQNTRTHIAEHAKVQLPF